MGFAPLASTSQAMIGGHQMEKRKPYFSPSLALQRRGFVLQVLKREGVKSVVELGCGEGSVLSALCRPADHIDDFPPLVQPPPDSTNARAWSAHKKLKAVPQPPDAQRQLHLRRLAGLDIRRDLLDKAALATRLSASEDANPALVRWEPLQIELWEGSLDIHNESFDSYECFVATEVVEHLPSPILDHFGRVVLGQYAPRLAIVTTPNHDFADYFPSSTTSKDEDQKSFQDPTGRTDRRFRDADHKFEWTAEEFRLWCRSVALEHDYTFTLTGVGSAKHYLHKDADDIPDIFATQCAIFRKHYSQDEERSPRSPKTVPLPFYQPSPTLKGQDLPTRQPHILRHSHLYKACADSDSISSLRKIRRVVKDEMTYSRQSQIILSSLWLRRAVAQACSGCINKLIEAVVAGDAEEWDFEITKNGSENLAGADAVTIYNAQLAMSRLDLSSGQEAEVKGLSGAAALGDAGPAGTDSNKSSPTDSEAC